MVHSSGPQLLPIVAEHADVHTINILASLHPFKVSYDLGVDSIAANQKILQQRRDCSGELSVAFEELIAIAIAKEIESPSLESLAESGVFRSARSSFQSDLAEVMAKLDSATVSPTSPKQFEDAKDHLIRW